jgi:hypothetical protein
MNLLPDDLIRGVIIPFFQSFATGLLIALAGLGICTWQGWPGWWSLAAGAIAALLSWLSNVNRWQRLIEAILAPELNQIEEHELMPQTTQPQSIRLEISNENKDGYLEGKFINLPIDPDRLRLLADGLEQGKGLTVASWTGSHGVFTRNEFELVRNELLIRGLIRQSSERTPQRGYELTVIGRHVFKRLSSPPLE